MIVESTLLMRVFRIMRMCLCVCVPLPLPGVFIVAILRVFVWCSYTQLSAVMETKGKHGLEQRLTSTHVGNSFSDRLPVSIGSQQPFSDALTFLHKQ